jgi:hypothetical protein
MVEQSMTACRATAGGKERVSDTEAYGEGEIKKKREGQSTIESQEYRLTRELSARV